VIGSNGGYTNYQFLRTGGPGATTRLDFQGYNPPAWEYLDDVSVTLSTDGPSVPEPGTFTLAGIAMLALAAGIRARGLLKKDPLAYACCSLAKRDRREA
jgi:hypothetical protein